jgi:hypothetical protein
LFGRFNYYLDTSDFVHSDDPEQALAGLGICVAQVSAIVNSFVNDHPANDPVWTEKKKKYTLQ